MSGANRRSQYRKHLTQQVLNEFPEPDVTAREYIAQITASRGGNLLEIQVGKDEDESESVELAILPSKFHKLVWVKRGDFLIVQGVAENSDQVDESDGNKVRYLVKHVLYKEQVKFLKGKPYWPSRFMKESGDNCDETVATVEPSALGADIDDRKIIMQQPYDIDEEYHEYALDDCDESDLFVNTNRIAALRVEDSDESSDEDD